MCNIKLIDEIISEHVSARDALMALREHFEPFGDAHLGFEFVLSADRRIRGDLINPTTLPEWLEPVYLRAGGPAFDPVIDRIMSGADSFSMDLRQVLARGPKRYSKSDFLKALVELGCPILTTISLPSGEVNGRVFLTVLDGGAWPLRYGETHQSRVLRAILRSFRRHGLLRRYFNLSPKEIIVVQHLASGQTANDFAESAGLSLRAIEMRLQNARRKLASRTTSEMIYKAASYGLI